MKDNSKLLFIALAAGILFGAGLVISGMTDSKKVQGFLDIFGNWDITLAFVMMGALALTLVTFRIILKQDKPEFDKKFHLPTSTTIDKKLVIGSFIFGSGWAIVGYCPGPAIASLAYGYWQTLVFIAAMLIGAHLGKRFT